MSPKNDTNEGMAKKSKEPEKKPVGRPKTLPAELNTRFQIRCAKSDETAWKKHAKRLGFTAGQWIRKTLNDAMMAER